MATYHADIGSGIKAESGDGSERWYRVLQEVGEGGNALTYLVIQTAGDFKGNNFALKIFKNISNEERGERFFEEQNFLENTAHPSILTYRDKGSYYGYPFLVAEYLPKTLEDVIRGDPVPIPERISYAVQLLSSLKHLHNLGPPVIHRDIKPSNIFIKGTSCVLGDFGLLKRAGSDSETEGMVWKESTESALPYFYRSPDMVSYGKNESPLTPKSDVFQLGLVLAELFTGWNPAERPENDDILSPVVLRDLGDIPSEMGGGIAALIDRMLEEDPEEREGAEELMDGWMGLFEDAADSAYSLNGMVF
ncbi:serine/threonine protein kinase [Halobaculum sp. D14]|uniref:serine/threonine protein kinase n=1 Tax=Halobaculum sp. D14 TaxID=3421642 RepID=UPI003EBF450C